MINLSGKVPLGRDRVGVVAVNALPQGLPADDDGHEPGAVGAAVPAPVRSGPGRPEIPKPHALRFRGISAHGPGPYRSRGRPVLGLDAPIFRRNFPESNRLVDTYLPTGLQPSLVPLLTWATTANLYRLLRFR